MPTATCGGAVGIAPLLEPGLAALGREIAVVVSGRNVDMGLFRRVLAGEVRPGFQTPAGLFGNGFAETIADTTITQRAI